MKHYILLFLLIAKTVCQGQNGQIRYAVKANMVENISLAKIEIQEQIKLINEQVNLQKFELNFNKELSLFKNTTLDSKNVSNDLHNNNIAATLTSDGILYYNSKNNFLISNIDNGTLLKETISADQWEITKEKKKIDQYTCFKAIRNTPFKNRKGESKIRTVIAWFSPELPYSFGPKNYVGLPGLVLEVVESNNLIYYATSIKFLKKPIKIVVPKGKTITKEAYEAKLKAQMGM